MQARNRHIVGDFEGAMESAQSAKNISIWAIIIGFILTVSVIAIRVVALTKNYWRNNPGIFF